MNAHGPAWSPDAATGVHVPAPTRPHAQDLYRAVAQFLPDGAAFVVDRELRYRLAEGQSLREAGMTSEQMEGRTVRELVPPAMADQVEGDYQRALEGGTFEREHQVGERWFTTHGVPLRDEGGHVYAALAVSYDITRIKQAELSLRSGKEALEQLNRRKDVFLATLAHELRNPLAPISFGVDLLRRLPLESEQASRTYSMLRNQISQISRLVEDLVDFAKVAEGKLRVTRDHVSVHEVVQLGVDATSPLMASMNHTFDIDTPGEPVVFQADRARVAQILSNLLNNAAKFTPAGGKIRLAVNSADGWVNFMVSDNGPGIPAAQLPQMFDMFAQLDTPINVEARGGLGIGLALVRKLAELHGGTITAHSDGAGLGSTFTVRLPVAAARPHPSPLPQAGEGA